MIDADKQQRKIMFQKAMSGADDDLFLWLAHQFYVESKIRLLQMPWDHEHPATIYAGKKVSNSEIASILSEIPAVSDDDVVVVHKKNGGSKKMYALDIEATPAGKSIWGVLGLNKKKSLVKASSLKKKPLVAPMALNYEQTLQALNTMYGAKLSKWVPIAEAPIVKKKAYDPVSMHIPKDAYILYQKTGIPAKTYCGKVKLFGKLFVKIDKILGNDNTIEVLVPYKNIGFVAVE